MDAQVRITLVLAILFNVLAHTSLKLGMIRSGDVFDKGLIGAVKIIAINPFVIVGITFFGLSLLAYCATLPRLSLSIAYPILTTGGFAIITLVSMLFFQEHLSLMQIIGLVFLALGIWFTSMF